jgi:hypothetical protein
MIPDFVVVGNEAHPRYGNKITGVLRTALIRAITSSSTTASM